MADKYDDIARKLTGDICDMNNSAKQYAIRAALRQCASEAFEEAAKEAEQPRVMFLSKAQVEDGILSDDHPTIRARAQMRREIADALRDKAKALRALDAGRGGEGA